MMYYLLIKPLLTTLKPVYCMPYEDGTKTIANSVLNVQNVNVRRFSSFHFNQDQHPAQSKFILGFVVEILEG